MSTTKIEWADKVYNPITGCSPVSAGCNKCYAKRMANRLRGRFGYPKENPFQLTLHQDRLDQPRKWKKPQRIFLGSMTDLFQDEVREKDLDWIFEVIEDCPQHTFMVLTKRPENIEQKLWGFDPGQTAACGPMRQFQFHGELPENLWIGVSVENQEMADKRIPLLLKVPGIKVRFVSAEPMLGPVNMAKLEFNNTDVNALRGTWSCTIPSLDLKGAIDWVICGGETGPGGRLLAGGWVRHLLNQCIDTNTPFFFKNWGSRMKLHKNNMSPEVAKTILSGNIIDGKTWQQFPKENSKC